MFMMETTTPLWSVVITDETGHVLFEKNPKNILSIASVGKVLLLLAIAEKYDDSELHQLYLHRRTTQSVADSGLWQFLDTEQLTAHDLVVLVSSVSDNWATNELLDLVGLSEVRDVARSWSLLDTELLDRVRDVRNPHDDAVAPHLAHGSARELCGLVRQLHHSAVGTPGFRVARWLSANTDLSLVASAFGLDPLAHRETGEVLELWNKTGTDVGVLADMGVVTGPQGTVCFAVLVNAEASEQNQVSRMSLRAEMRLWGERIIGITGPTQTSTH